MSKVRFAIVGCGNIGKRHALHIEKNPHATLTWACDIVKERANEVAQKYACKKALDHNSLLTAEDIDVVNICTPNNSHAPLSIDFLANGKHVICEKPMCLTEQAGREMIEQAKKAGKHLFIVKQNRYNPPVKAAKKVMEKNRLGKPYLCNINVYWNRRADYYENSNWKGTQEQDGGTLYTQASHFLDLMLWLFGDVKSVRASVANYNHDTEIDDTGVVLIHFKNGARGSINYTTCIYDRNFEGSIYLLGTKGTIKIGGEYLNKLEKWNVANTSAPNIPKGNPPNDYGTYKGSMSNHDKVIQNAIDVLKKKGAVSTTAEEGLSTVKLINAIYKSAETGQEVLL